MPVRDEQDLVLAVAVARRHYEQNQAKTEIAEALGISRFKVARLLDLAHEAGVVRIEIVEPVADGGLARDLEQAFDLRCCSVVPMPSSAPEVRSEVGRAAARLLGRTLQPGDVLGLPWSRSVYDMVDALETLPQVPIVQLSGALAGVREDSSAVDLVRRAGRIAGGGRQVFFAPLVMPDAAAAQAVRRDPAVRDTLAAADQVTVAMVGVGAWEAGQSTIHDAVDAECRERVREVGVVGESVGACFDGRGRLVSTCLSDRLIALSPDQLRAIDTVIAVSYGQGKVEALRAAMTGDLVNGLVTTQDTAQALLA
ncbi:putative transcriptional regulator [Serinicoccus hydrothermalis]|uniref:Putative transcriptional regulator n=1 Tax=Serinicoccus hydrothermalis TaxID=1758689 RepID=A0A1B1N7M5_9MICO|nr:sugar-binding domain-containing protein [Serinicoccus hydrothermalis]ANS77427.1 putative transcriptional regulator [Serinicoccus hydrothermalis]